MRAVNLLSGDSARTARVRRPSRRASIAFALAFTLLAALAGAAVLEGGKVAKKRQQLEALRAELAVARRQAKPQTSARLVDEQKRRATALADALSRRVAWDRILRNVSLVLPDDVWLSGLTATSPAAAPGASPPADGATGLSLKGYTYSHDAVARLLTRLAVIPDLENVELEKSGRTELGRRPIVDFAISAGVRLPGAES